MLFFFFQAEDGIRDLVRSRGLGDVYKRQGYDDHEASVFLVRTLFALYADDAGVWGERDLFTDCLLYTSDAADDLLCVDLGGRRIIKKKKKP